MQLPVKLAIGGGIGFLFTLVVGWWGFSAFLQHQIKGTLTLKPGSDIRQMWSKVPFPLDFKIYLFNITNPLNVQNGDSPVVDEVGPFFYDEYKEKVNLEDNESSDTVSFNMKDTWVFNQKRSGKLTGDELITIPHPLIVGLATAVARERPGMLSLVNKALLSIHKNPETVFLTAPAKDILFGGVVVDCNVSDFPGKSVCAVLRTEAKELEHVDENTFKFSFFGSKNGTAGKRFKVKRGIQNSRDLGRVIEYDNETEMDVWPTKQCNQYNGTDSTIFPPFLPKEDGLVSFAPDLCRSLAAYYVNSYVYKGIPVRSFTADLGDMSKNKDEKCYCPTPETCLKKGMYDLTKCIGSPIIASLPHFYKADESYLEQVRGLHPNEEEHSISILFEPMTGTPVAAHKRLQFNMPFGKLDKISLMKELPTAIVPLFWIEEGVELNSTYIDQLDHDLFRTLRIFKVMKWLLLVVFAGILGAAGFLHYRKKMTFPVTPTYPPEQQKNNGISTIGHPRF